ncbi:MAG: cation:proton antiporter [Rickettsiaceae bacterium]|nr:cation:proton antiporter [Rickettsiaceae bacterium]
MYDSILITVITLIATAVFIVAFFQRLNLSPVLGYLVAGTVLGDYGLRVITYEQTYLLGEMGVVFLLFAIGLELSIERLKAMRKYVFGLGSLQVLITAVVIAAAIVVTTNNSSMAIIIAGGLALSSTAIVMQVIDESNSSTMQIGRISLAILLLQDFVVVPLLVIVPLLGNGENMDSLPYILGNSLVKTVIALGGIFIVGRVFLRPLFAFISPEHVESSELPIAVTLLVVLGAAWSTEHFGLSLALGAFVSGVLVAETDFRVTAEESIYPFKSLLLGLFFMSVGMKIDVMTIYNQLGSIITFSFALIILKSSIIAGLCILFGFSRGVSIHAGLLLSQGGEFAFILFGLGKECGVLEETTANLLLLIVTFTMALTPILGLVGRFIYDRIEKNLNGTPEQIIERGAQDLTNHIIIVGSGKIGRMVAKVLEAEGVNYIALDINNEVVSKETAEGMTVFRGNASQLSTLEAVGASRAAALVITINNNITVKKMTALASENFSNLEIIVRTRDLKNSNELYNLGAHIILPQDYEIGLQIGANALRSVGISDNEITRIKKQFRLGNYVIMNPLKGDLLNEAE